MSACRDLTGKRFGRWVVLMRAENTITNRSKWLCKCDCGNIKTVKLHDLRNGRSKSCGCLRKEITRKQFSTHHKTNTRLFRIWASMKTRCLNPNASRYKDWGGRGIGICAEWKNNFQSFYDWAISNGYSDDLSIDRIDNNGDYSPDNCRWITQKEQMKNTRRVKNEKNN